MAMMELRQFDSPGTSDGVVSVTNHANFGFYATI
jgi:hypothetical protein